MSKRTAMKGLAIALLAVLGMGFAAPVVAQTIFSDLIPTKDGPATADPNTVVSYTITVTNQGQDASTGARFDDALPADLTFVSLTKPAAWSCTTPAVGTNGTITCTVSTLARNTPASFTLQTLLSAAAVPGSFVTNQAITSVTDPINELDVTPENDSAPSTLQVNGGIDADLAITKLAPAGVLAGGNIAYTMTVTNNGPAASTNPTMSDQLPGGTTFVSVSAPTGWLCSDPGVGNNGTVSCATPTLAAGAPQTMSIVTKADNASIVGDVFTNIATIDSSAPGENDANSSNDSATATTFVTATAAPDLLLQKSHSGPAVRGQNFSYSLDVSNVGSGSTTGTITLTDTLPTGFTAVSMSGTGWTCDASTATCTTAAIVASGGVLPTVTLVVMPSGTANTVQNEAQVTTLGDTNGLNNMASDTTSVITLVDLAISKAGPVDAIPGDMVEYQIAAANLGLSPATSVVLTDMLPSTLTFVGITPPGGWSCTTPAVGASGTITCTTPSLGPSLQGQFALQTTLSPTATGSFSNTATVASSDTDVNPTDNTSMSTVAVVIGPDLTITKSAPATATASSPIVYGIAVANTGGIDMPNVVLTDVLPTGTTFASITAPGGWSCTTPAIGTGGTVTCTTATLATGGSGSFTLSVTAPANPGLVSNTATVSGSGFETNTANNSANASTTVTALPLADVAVTNTAPATAAIGGTIPYAITVTNNGPDAASAATLVDNLPANATFVSLVSPSGWACNTPAVGAAGTVSCNIATLASGGSGAFTLSLAAAAGFTGTIINHVEAISGTADPATTNNAQDASTSIGLPPPTTTTLNVSPNPATVGNPVTLTATVTSAGGGTPTGAVTFFDHVANLGTVALTGNMATLIVTTFGVAPHEITATFDSDVPTSFPTSTSAPVALVVQPVAPPPPPPPPPPKPTFKASLALSFSPPQFYAVGQVITVNYLITNTGTGALTFVWVRDPKVPAMVCFLLVFDPGQSVTCGGSYTITAADIAAGSSTFTATASYVNGDLATATATIQSGANAVTDAFNQLGQNFVDTRSKLVGSGINPPGLNDTPGNSLGLSENQGDPTLNFSATLFGAGAAAESLASTTVAPLPFRVWIDGSFTLHTRDNGGGNFGLVGVGADYKIDDRFLAGVALYLDTMTDMAKLGNVTGRGVMVGPYVSIAVAPRLTFDASLFYGRTWNDATVPMAGNTFNGTFETERLLGKARLQGQWMLDQLVIRPDATLYISSETAGTYTVRDAMGNALPIAGFSTQTLDLSGGATFERSFDLPSGIEFVPEIGFRLGVNGSGSALTLSDPYGTGMVGFRLAGEHWTFRTSAETSLFASSLKTATWRAGMSGRF